jgi:alpha-L-rhamnosidase
MTDLSRRAGSVHASPKPGVDRSERRDRGSQGPGARCASLLLLLMLTGGERLPAQGAPEIDPARLTQPWPARWIAHPEAPANSFSVQHFRRTLELGERPDRFVVHVSADNRYRLYVNGTTVGEGPAWSDLMHWRFETVDIAPYLRVGENVVAAKVWNWGAHRPVAQISLRTAFVLQGDTEPESVLDTGPEWTAFWNRGYAAVPVTGEDIGNTYYASPPGESVDGREYPWGWESPGFGAAGWVAAEAAVPPVWPASGATPRGSHPYGTADHWQLVPRPIPAMESSLQRFATVRRSDGVPADPRFLQGAGDLVVPPHTRATLLLDQSFNTNGYAIVQASGGEAATLTLTFAESLVDADGAKGQRDEVDGKRIRGLRDRIVFDGGERRRFQSLWFRTFRYVQLEIETADQPLRVHDVHSLFTGFPLEERGFFASDQRWIDDMWRINWRTLRLCAWETYFDTPYYEQLQYVGDTRIQALLSLYIAGDDRLMRNAIELFDQSFMGEGLTHSRYPSNITQLIPPYSLFWIAMLHDHWMLRDDHSWLRRFLPNMRTVLAWYEGRVDATGLVGGAPWWNYVDSPAFPRGVPPGADDGNSVVVTLQFAYALRQAAELEAALGEADNTRRYHALAEALGSAAREHAWVESRGLFADTPERDTFSQHANVLAVLAGLVPVEEQRPLMERVLTDPTMTGASFYFRFYVDEAMREAGLAERYLERLEPWREMLALGLTTTPEHPEPTRSDSHAWSAHPNYGLLATVLGVRPAEPGFRGVRIAPDLGPLARASGRVAHPDGDIEVELHRSGTARIYGVVTLPNGVNGVFEWGGRNLLLREGRQEVELERAPENAAAGPGMPGSRTTSHSPVPRGEHRKGG